MLLIFNNNSYQSTSFEHTVLSKKKPTELHRLGNSITTAAGSTAIGTKIGNSIAVVARLEVTPVRKFYGGDYYQHKKVERQIFQGGQLLLRAFSVKER